MKWSLFVLDFDDTYNNEYEEELGVNPMVYLVPTERMEEVHKCARKAHDDFHEADDGDLCICDYFVLNLNKRRINYTTVGDIKLTFGERQCEYLSSIMEMEVV